MEVAQLRLPIRLTDRRSDYDEAQPATVQDFSFPVTIGCGGTSSTAIGASCNIATFANALVPGAVPDGRRSIWELDQVAVYDGGADGDADTAADNALFAAQGVYAP
jgi:hypothetical protein